MCVEAPTLLPFEATVPDRQLLAQIEAATGRQRTQHGCAFGLIYLSFASLDFLCTGSLLNPAVYSAAAQLHAPLHMLNPAARAQPAHDHDTHCAQHSVA